MLAAFAPEERRGVCETHEPDGTAKHLTTHLNSSDRDGFLVLCDHVCDCVAAGELGVQGTPMYRPQLRALAIEARARRMSPEQLLCALKQSWSARPEVRDPRRRSEATVILAKIVTICIEEYFRPPVVRVRG